MRKIIFGGLAAALCTAMISARAFAADILNDKSVYAEDQQLIAQAMGSWEYDGKKVMPDPGTIMPVYGASIYDYAQTGSFEVTPLMLADANGNITEDQHYISDAIDENGNFVGTMELLFGGKYTGIGSYLPSAKNKVESVAFNSDAKRINALMKKRGLNTSCNEIKLVSVTGLGFVYYIDNGEGKLLAAANLGGVNGNFFNNENGGLIVIDDDFKAKAEAELKSYNTYLEEWQKILDSLDPNTPPPTGGYETPTFKADNTPYLENEIQSENGNSSTVGAGENPPTFGAGENPPTTGAEPFGVGKIICVTALAVLGIGAITFGKKRSDH